MRARRTARMFPSLSRLLPYNKRPLSLAQVYGDVLSLTRRLVLGRRLPLKHPPARMEGLAPGSHPQFSPVGVIAEVVAYFSDTFLDPERLEKGGSGSALLLVIARGISTCNGVPRSVDATDCAAICVGRGRPVACRSLRRHRLIGRRYGGLRFVLIQTGELRGRFANTFSRP